MVKGKGFEDCALSPDTTLARTKCSRCLHKTYYCRRQNWLRQAQMLREHALLLVKESQRVRDETARTPPNCS